MERSGLDKIDTKCEHKELLDLYYKIELMYFVKGLIYDYYASKGLV